MSEAQRFPYIEIDTSLGAASVLPYVPLVLELDANVASVSAILETATVGQFGPVRLAFAWSRNNQVPVILGQFNVFMEFDVCFIRSQSAFEVTAR